MSADPHRESNAEQVFLYALQALPPDEAAVAGAHIGGCASCRHELESLRSTIEAFAAWPYDVLRPATPLWERIAQRVAAETGGDPVPPGPSWIAPEWKDVAPGIACKVLATDSESHRVSLLVRLSPGTAYPPHRHGGVEELHLLDGELWIGDRKLYPGDYNRAEPGTEDHRVWSETGCTCVLITSDRDIILPP
jgi:anti-sigma factor ChrR (cupin superfamily)